MNHSSNPPNRRTSNGSKIAPVLLLIIAASYWVAEARAEDIWSGSDQLSEQSFALLDRLSKQSGKPNPLVGPIASFAGDALSLRQSLARRDLRSAKASMAALQADSSAIDQALVQHPGAIPAQEWRALREHSEKIAREIPGCSPDCGAAVSGSGVASTTATISDRDGPRIVITSRESDGGVIRLRGYFEGTAIRSAGIYAGSDQLRPLKVDHVAGRERVEFDLRLEDPSPATVLRVVDSEGRSDESPVNDQSFTSSPTAESAADSVPSIPPGDGSEPPPDMGSHSATAEIPSHGPFRPSPSKRHTLGSRLGDVNIEVLRVTRIANLPPTYAIFGQIAGHGVTHAGIYLNGRLIRPIPIMKGSNFNRFDQQIIVQSGPTSIRAYAVGNHFVEQPVDLSDAAEPSELEDLPDNELAMAAPMTATRIAVQITSIQALAGGTYLVSGIISGGQVAAAGLYQNGVLAQRINLSSGIAGALAALIPGASRSISFSVGLNPYAGPATIRAFDSSGAYTEQPVIVAGISPYAPSWPNSLYGGTGSLPYGTGLPTSRYRNRPGSKPLPW